MTILTYDEAKKAEGQQFRISSNGVAQDLVLASVTKPEKPNPYPGQMREPFSMFFKGEPGRYCDQQAYTMINEILGVQEIFLVPIAYDTETNTYTYQAAFH